MSESSIEISKLRWHCRRGVKELDVVLTNFLDNHYDNVEPDVQQGFIALLELEDPELLSLVMGYHQTDDSVQRAVLDTMRGFYSA